MDATQIVHQVFTDGVACISHEYNIVDIINNAQFKVDEIETDVESMILTPEMIHTILSQFNEVFEKYAFLWGNNITAKLSLHRKCHYKVFEYHTDYYDCQSDFFILFYPMEWDNNNGGQVCFGVEDVNSEIVSQKVYFLTQQMLLIVNNMNPLFKHSVLPCTNDSRRYLGCIEITKGTF